VAWWRLLRRVDRWLVRARREVSYLSTRPLARGALAGLIVLALAAAAGAYALALWRAPDWAHAHGAGDRHDVRVLVVSIAGAVVVAISLLYTARTYRLSHRGQVTDRFTKALERLSSSDVDARLGGIYTLAHVANDSRPHHDDVVEVLEAFIRRRAPATRPTRLWPHDPPLPDRLAADVQAALTALASRPPRPERRQLDLSGLQLTGARLIGVVLRDADLHGAILRGADLRGADLSHADLRGADLSHANLSHGNLNSADLSGAYLRHSDLRGANLRHADLSHADLRGAYLRRAYLSRAYLSGVDLSHANMRAAILRRAYLSRADLSHANLNSANLNGANLDLANLRGAYLSGAYLTAVDLNDVDLSDVDLSGTHLLDVNLPVGFPREPRAGPPLAK
jgi:uncharacterized protein YjbI with pentapeptide repeats